MAIKHIEFIQIESVLDSLGRKQIGVEPDVDSELNFRMWGGKDSTGALTHWLAKNKPGLLHSLRLSSLAGQSQSIAKIDANGNIVRGSIDTEDLATKEYVDAKASSLIKDNARDDVTDPMHPDNITAIEQIIFVRNVGADANYTFVTSEERTYGVLIPHPSMEADVGKVPMYKTGNQIVWEPVASGVTTTVSEITENTTVTLVAGQNRYLNCTNSPTILVEIADNNIYHLQINGSCTLALTGVSWGGDAITAITTKAEISILNGIAVGVLYE